MVTVSLEKPWAQCIYSIFPLCMESNALEKSTNKSFAFEIFLHKHLWWFNKKSESEKLWIDVS